MTQIAPVAVALTAEKARPEGGQTKHFTFKQLAIDLGGLLLRLVLK